MNPRQTALNDRKAPMKDRNSLALAAASAMLAIGLANPAWADPVDDWLAHKIPAAEPKIVYAGEPIELKYSYPQPPASIVPPVWQQAFGWLTEATNKKLSFKLFGAGTLVGIRDGFKGVGAGISDYGTCFTAFEGRGFELTKVFAQPFLATGSALANTRIYLELAEKYFVPEFERQGVYYGYSVHLVSNDIMSKKPIRSLDDLRGLKIIAQGVGPETAKAFGFVTLNIPFPEIYTAAQQGIADAVIWTDGGFVPYKIYEIFKYRTTLDIVSPTMDTCLNRKSFDGLPADLKTALYNFQQYTAAAVAQRTVVDFHKKALGVYKENGVELITLPAAELERGKAMAKPVIDEWIAAREKEGKPGRALIEDIAKLKAKYAAMSDEQMLKLMLEQPVKGIIKF
jgi:TRAP-type C4-dicarboxylate transport system substrate-binding protein